MRFPPQHARTYSLHNALATRLSAYHASVRPHVPCGTLCVGENVMYETSTCSLSQLRASSFERPFAHIQYAIVAHASQHHIYAHSAPTCVSVMHEKLFLGARLCTKVTAHMRTQTQPTYVILTRMIHAARSTSRQEPYAQETRLQKALLAGMLVRMRAVVYAQM